MRRGTTRLGTAAAFSLTALVMGGSASIAQEASAPVVDVAVLEALCAANTPDEPSRANCLNVTHTYLVPGSGPSLAPSVEPSEVDVDALEALCVGHAPDQPELANCLAVIHVYIVPGSAPEPPFPPAPSLGFTYIDQNLSVTLLGVRLGDARTGRSIEPRPAVGVDAGPLQGT